MENSSCMAGTENSSEEEEDGDGEEEGGGAEERGDAESVGGDKALKENRNWGRNGD